MKMMLRKSLNITTHYRIRSQKNSKAKMMYFILAFDLFISTCFKI